MDGNRRYAKVNHLDSYQSYLQGLKQLFEVLVMFLIIKNCKVIRLCLIYSQIVLMGDLIGLEEISVFAFSVENFKRSQEEVDLLMNLFLEFAEKVSEKVSDKEVSYDSCGFRFYGCLELLSVKHQKIVADYIKKSQNSSPRLVILLVALKTY